MQPLLLGTLFVLGMVALMISFVLYQVFRINWLKHHGRQIVAVVTSIRPETGKTGWGFARDNYYVTAQWTNPRTGRTYTFWTWVMNARPSFAKGSLIPVLIDPRHPARYALNA